jgi:hypothetical protein
VPRPLSDSPNPGAGLRAEAELIKNPKRSDRLVAEAARCEHKLVCSKRRELAAAGLISDVPLADRVSRTPPPRCPGKARLAERSKLARPGQPRWPGKLA